MILERQCQGELSPVEESVLEYLASHPAGLEKLTIQELAKATYSSNATIIRLCRKFGFSGFREFRVALGRELEQQKTVTHTVDYSYPFQEKADTAAIAQNLYSLFQESIRTVHTHLDLQQVEQVVSIIQGADRTFLFGVGDTRRTIEAFINKCAKINFFPILATQAHEHSYICSRLGPRDCAVFLSYSGQGPDFEACVKILNRRRVPVVGVTANPESYLVRQSQCCILLPNLETLDRTAKIATFSAQLSFEYLLDLIFSLLYRDDQLKAPD